MNFADRVRDTSATSGTGPWTLAGSPPTGRRSFSAAFSVGADKIPVVLSSGSQWQTCWCTLTGSTTLRCDAVLDSSTGGAAVSFSGTIDVVVALTAAHLRAVTIETDDPGFDIVGVFGQSNAVGQGTFDSSVDLADNRVWQFGCKSGDARYQTIFSGVDPLHTTERVNTGYVSAGTWAARALANVTPSHRRILLVPACYGGTGLIYGPPGNWAYGSPTGGTYYENAITQTNLAITAAQLWYPSSRFVGFFWMQGEADNAQTQAAYASALSAMIAGMRGRITGATNSWVVISQMVPTAISTRSGYANIALAHQQTALEVAKVGYVSGPSGYTPDDLHYNAAGLRIVGSKLGSAVPAARLKVASSVSAPGQPTSLANGTMTTTTAPLTWAAPGSGGTPLHVFVEYKAAASGTWLTFLTAYGTMTSATITGLSSSTSYNFRITYANEAGKGTPSSTLTVSTAGGGASVPDAPTIGTATAGDAAASVTFTAPGSDGGSAITGYTVTSTPGSITGTGASSPIVVSGLTNGTAYTFTAHATNAIGNSSESAASNSVTPAAASYASWDAARLGTDITLSNSNKTATKTTSGAFPSVQATGLKSSGKWYCEITIDGGTNIMLGVGNASASLSQYPGQNTNSVGYYSAGGQKFVNAASSGYGAGFATTNVVRLALDADGKTVDWAINGGSWQGTIDVSGITGALALMYSSQNAGAVTVNWGQSTFAYTPKSGHSAWTA